MSKKDPLTISPDLTIPGFDVTVHSPHSCQVKSQDGRYEFSVEIDESCEYPLTISGNMFKRFCFGVAGESWGIEYTTDADDIIIQVANLLKLMDKLSSEGFSAKIEEWASLVLSHPSKPDYSLRMHLTHARKFAFCADPSIYTTVEYCGPAYDKKINAKWQLDGIDNGRLIVTNKGLEELAQEIKARILSLGEEKDPRIAQWVSEEIEKDLAPNGFTFVPKPGKDIVEFSHPTGLSGTLSFAPFTADGNFVFNPKYPNLQFPTDIEKPKVVLFSCARPNSRKPYTKAFLVEDPQEVVNEFLGLLALPLVYQEVCQAWKSNLLVPKLRYSKILLVNPELAGNDSIILELTREKDKLVLKGMEEERFYPMSNTPLAVDTKAITQDIAELAEKYVQLNRAPELVYAELSKVWKSDILVPMLRHSKLLLINTELDGDDSIILELTVEKGKLNLKCEWKSYEISDNPEEIAQTIAGLSEKHVQEFIQENEIKLTNTKVVEIDF